METVEAKQHDLIRSLTKRDHMKISAKLRNEDSFLSAKGHNTTTHRWCLIMDKLSMLPVCKCTVD